MFDFFNTVCTDIMLSVFRNNVPILVPAYMNWFSGVYSSAYIHNRSETVTLSPSPLSPPLALSG